MNIFKLVERELTAVLADLGAQGVVPEGLDTARISVEPPRDPAHGDVATNAAMVLSKQAKSKPRDLAEQISFALKSKSELIESADIAGPGFINLRLSPAVWPRVVADILDAGTAYGASDLGAGEKVNIEYVSANPTGPLHIGHARGAVVGDVLARLMTKTGFDVTKEYWINDAGGQIAALAAACYFRYLELLNPVLTAEDFTDAMGSVDSRFAELQYMGEYLIPVGKALVEKHGNGLAEQDDDGNAIPTTDAKLPWFEPVREVAVAMMMDDVRASLKELGIEQDVFTSEKWVIDSGKVDDVLEYLMGNGLIYTGVLEPPKGQRPEDWEPREQTLFRATDFGDDVDRPLQKSDGSWTYFASDIAYHHYKYARGFKRQIDVWGADHGGYVKRMQSAVKAVSEGNASLTVKLCQMVRLMDKGEPLKMSKRAGNFVTLSDLVDAVGRDVVRFFLLTRKNDAPMDFDLTAVKEQSRDNPVFYVHYAHARCRSVFRMAGEQVPEIDLSTDALKGADLTLLNAGDEILLIRQMAEWQRLLEGAADAEEPHRIAYYLYDLAAAFHSLWTKGKDDAALRVIRQDAPEVTRARLALVEALRLVIASGLDVFGVEPVDELN